MGHRRARAVIAVRARVECGNRRRSVPEARQLVRDSTGQRDATSRDADQDDALQLRMALGNLVREADRDALHRARIEEVRAVVERQRLSGHAAGLIRAASRGVPS
jgi:hypothetical protein